MKRLMLCLLLLMQHNLWAEGSREWLASKIAQLESEKQPPAFFNTHHLVFFFSSTCPHCHNSAPHLKAWTNQVNVEVDAYSFDGRGLPEFPEAKPVTNELVASAFQTNTIQYPALFIMNQRTHALYPVVVGEFTFSELVSRMKGLVPKIIAFEGART